MTTRRRTRTNIHMFSARKQAFLYFLAGAKPWLVAELIGSTLATTQRYYTSWQKLPPGLDQNLVTARAIWRSMRNKEKTAFASVLSSKLGCDPQGVLARMGRPWALRDLLTGKWLNWQIGGNKRKLSRVTGPVQGLQKLLLPANVKPMLELILWSPYTPEDRDSEEKQRSRSADNGNGYNQ